MMPKTIFNEIVKEVNVSVVQEESALSGFVTKVDKF